MHFDLIDRVIESDTDRLVSLKHVSAAEEYLQDHFPGFPVLPGVMMLEAMVQAGRRLCAPDGTPLVLGTARALKYARMVRPGDSLRVEVRLQGEAGGTFDLKGEVGVIEPGSSEPRVAASGRFTLRPVKVGVGGRVGYHGDSTGCTHDQR